MNISSGSNKPHDIFRRGGQEGEARDLVGGELTQHLIARYIGPGDTEGRIGVTVISIYGQLPVVHAPREADAREDHTVLVTLAGRAHRVLGYGHLLRYAGRAGRP